MYLQLKGKILTPIVTKKTEFYLKGCIARILNPKRRYFGKIQANVLMYPYSYICYLGNIELTYECKTKKRAKEKLVQLLKIKAIGKLTAEGLGLIKWVSGIIVKQIESTNNSKKYRKIKLRKGLPSYLPERVQFLIKYGLLHDFFHTNSHRSKIYLEPNLADSEFVKLLKKHHDNTENEVIKEFQQYDRRSALISRKVRSPINSRYNWKAKSAIDFHKLADEIAEAEKKGVWKLYKFIYASKELEQLVETLEHGHSNMRYHLLLISNMIVENYLRK